MLAIRKAIRNFQIAAYSDPSISPEIKALGHTYPWQLYSKMLGVQLTAKLAASFPAEALQEELHQILELYSPRQQFGQYHLGGWTGVALHAIDGNPLEDQDHPDGIYQKTEALKLAPTMEAIMDSFPCEKRRVRILRLSPGKKVFWHRDFWHSVDSTQLRLHIPIVTNSKVAFQISHQDCPWQPGELWYGDFTFPHRLQNGGEHERVHLVVDLMQNDAARALLPQSVLNQHKVRTKARRGCNSLLNLWGKVFATEMRLAQARVTRSND